MTLLLAGSFGECDMSAHGMVQPCSCPPSGRTLREAGLAMSYRSMHDAGHTPKFLGTGNNLSCIARGTWSEDSEKQEILTSPPNNTRGYLILIGAAPGETLDPAGRARKREPAIRLWVLHGHSAMSASSLLYPESGNH